MEQWSNAQSMPFYSGFVRVDLFGISIIERASISTKELTIYFTHDDACLLWVGVGCFRLLLFACVTPSFELP